MNSGSAVKNFAHMFVFCKGASSEFERIPPHAGQHTVSTGITHAILRKAPDKKTTQNPATFYNLANTLTAKAISSGSCRLLSWFERLRYMSYV